jgi:aminopeptidase N
VATLLDKMDLENANEEVMNKLLPIIVKNRITSQMPNIAKPLLFIRL